MPWNSNLPSRVQGLGAYGAASSAHSGRPGHHRRPLQPLTQRCDALEEPLGGPCSLQRCISAASHRTISHAGLHNQGTPAGQADWPALVFSFSFSFSFYSPLSARRDSIRFSERSSRDTISRSGACRGTDDRGGQHTGGSSQSLRWMSSRAGLAGVVFNTYPGKQITWESRGFQAATRAYLAVRCGFVSFFVLFCSFEITVRSIG
ncbi:hypothetical protein J3F83DRAFT_722993 [Trichoderma novae-zelandiae]